ncbi:H-NS family nucleoid-associated regulatory protein [Vreelandella subglaciescola]|jgi:DNA-binding protein H-NS|uniref:H-NS histone family protein n=1 Tax=Vreelandella subglaciescola TaxID=29571 RepID=A0A1M7I6R6_9GAMM|nr:H-NS family nucleoid-associated regulatory protein [Halomonas subglaciescola]SHM36319.1 H-NS histone family protein [Halomonas subglaciescola]
MKAYLELKAEKEAIEKQMEDARKNERKAVIKQVRELCKEFKITAGHLKGTLAEGRKPKAK